MLDALDDRRALAQHRDHFGAAQFDSRQPVHRAIVNARAARFKRATEAKSRKATAVVELRRIELLTSAMRLQRIEGFIAVF